MKAAKIQQIHERQWVSLCRLAREFGVRDGEVTRRRPAFARVPARRDARGGVLYDRAGAAEVLRGLFPEMEAHARRSRSGTRTLVAPDAPPPSVTPLPPCVACEIEAIVDERPARIAIFVPLLGTERVTRCGVICGRYCCDGAIEGLSTLETFPLDASEEQVRAAVRLRWEQWALDALKEVTHRRRTTT